MGEDVLETHCHLAVGHLPQDPTVLATYATGVLPLLGEFRIVQGEDSFLGREPEHHLLYEADLDQGPVPRGVGVEILQSVRGDPATLGQRFHAVAVSWGTETHEVGLGVGAGLLPRTSTSRRSSKGAKN